MQKWYMDGDRKSAKQERGNLTSDRFPLSCCLSSVELRMQFGKTRGLLISVREGREFGVFIQAGEECDRHRCTGATNVIVVAFIGFWRLGGIVAAQAVGHDQRWMTGEIGGQQLRAAG